MILVDVFVPSLNNHYEFQLDEHVNVGLVIEEIAEMICQKEQCRIVGNKNKLILCKYHGEEIIDNTTTLEQNKVVDGERLILV